MAEETPTAWYVVHTQTGYEERVKKKILLDVETHQMGEQIFQALVPTEEVREVKQNKEIRHQRKFFPSYVLVEMKMTSEAYWFIRNITGVSGFLGDPSPVPLSEEDVTEI